MKTLGKCKRYLITSLAAILLMVGTAVSDNHTDVSTEEIQQMTQKPTIMILGSPLLANWGGNLYNTKMDDVLTPKRQAEIQELIDQLARFKPTKVAGAADTRREAEHQLEYDAYLQDDFQLQRHEMHQIGFRLAKQTGHSKIYCVGYFGTKESPRLPESKIDWATFMDFRTFAKTHDQEHFLRSPPLTEGKIVTDREGTTWIEPEKYVAIIDIYRRSNAPENTLADHQWYLTSARIGLGDKYPGANWVVHNWYAMNLKIFVNLTRITESPDDRILLIIGAGHVYLIQQFLEDSGDYIVESPLQYLNPAPTD